jgi:hypothetical protein
MLIPDVPAHAQVAGASGAGHVSSRDSPDPNPATGPVRGAFVLVGYRTFPPAGQGAR